MCSLQAYAPIHIPHTLSRIPHAIIPLATYVPSILLNPRPRPLSYLTPLALSPKPLPLALSPKP